MSYYYVGILYLCRGISDIIKIIIIIINFPGGGVFEVKKNHETLQWILVLGIDLPIGTFDLAILTRAHSATLWEHV